MAIATSAKPSAVIVNDDPTQLRLTSTILARDGFEVLPALGVEDALRILQERGTVDVIVTDLYMPGIDGWRFCRLLRSSSYEKFNAIPILVVSATFSGADAEELTAQLGANEFLPAPYEPAMLRRTVRELLGNTKAPRLPNLLLVGTPNRESMALKGVFETHGYSVSCATSSEEALQRFRGVMPQIVVIDYDHAGQMVDRLIEGIKEPATASVVIVMTSDRSPETALGFIRAGADNYVHKPVAPEYLLHLCEIAVRQRALLRVEELLELRTRRLRDSEERYRGLFENAGDGITACNVEGIIIGVNRALENLATVSRDDIVGKSIARLMASTCFADVMGHQEQARFNKQSSWQYETELVRSDGSVVPVDAHCRFLPSQDAQPSTILAMYRDITQQKQLERQRGEFTAMLAHDIRNPIGLILNCTELLLDHDGPALDPATTDKCLRRIRDDARILESLVSNYLHASRIEAGQLNISRHNVDLTALLRRIVERYECEAQPKSIRLDIAVPNDCKILGDGLALDRVFGNLLSNALKFTPSGGAIRVGLERCRGDAVVTVSDTGPGVNPKKLSSLFQKFNRIEITECQEGVGLGLYIVKELVAAHGGRVDAHSAMGQGSCFTVSLPLNGQGHAMAASPSNF